MAGVVEFGENGAPRRFRADGHMVKEPCAAPQAGVFEGS